MGSSSYFGREFVGVSAGMSWWGMGVGGLVGWAVFYVGLSVFRWLCWGEPVMGGACFRRGEKRGRLGYTKQRGRSEPCMVKI